MMPYFDDLPPIVLPRVFAINWPPYQWCELRQVRDLVRPLSALAMTDYDPTSEQLVHDFAALAPYNHQVVCGKQPQILRYVVSPPQQAVTYGGTEVPQGHHPYFKGQFFKLGVGTPYPESLFVPMQWALDTLSAVLVGAVCVTEHAKGDAKSKRNIRLIGMSGTGQSYDIDERRMTA